MAYIRIAIHGVLVFAITVFDICDSGRSGYL